MKTFLAGLVVGVLVALGIAYRWDRGHATEIAVWKQRYNVAKAVVRHDSVQVVKYETRVRTLRDTVLQQLTDTQLVREFVYRTDTLRQRCMACIASAAAAVRIADTVIVKVGANQRRWTDRFGLTAGYGVQFARDGRLTHGLQVSLSARLWP